MRGPWMVAMFCVAVGSGIRFPRSDASTASLPAAMNEAMAAGRADRALAMAKGEPFDSLWKDPVGLLRLCTGLESSAWRITVCQPDPARELFARVLDVATRARDSLPGMRDASVAWA